MRSRNVIVPAILVALGVVAPAHAAITSSNITAPADGTHFLITDASPPASVPVTGTSNGTTGDAVDIRCYNRPDRWDGENNNIPVAADGSFSTTIMSDAPYGTCILRAVPHGLPSTGDASPFTGPVLTTEQNISYKVSSGPNAGKVYDYYVLFQQPGALNDYVSAARGGLWDSRLQSSPGHTSAYLWYEDGSLVHDEDSPTNDRSTVQVDGRNAYGPGGAQDLFENNPGLPSLTYDVSRDAAAGTTTIHETDPFVVCPNETPFPPTALSCPQFNDAGVALDRTWTSDDGGLQVHMTDTWRSTDNNAHTLSLHYREWVSAYAPDYSSVDVGLRLPWLGDFATFTSDTVFPGPGPGAGSVFLRSNNAVPEGSDTYPVAAISFDVAPTDVRRLSNKHFQLRDENLTVPAGGTLVVRQDFVSGTTVPEVQAKAAASVDRLSGPTVAISSPANGSTVTGATSTKQVNVTGSAADNNGILSLTLNGAAVQLASGAFSTPVTLKLGANKLTAVATDHAGNTATAEVTATYADNVAPSVTGFTALPRTFSVAAGATPVSARAARGTKFEFSLSEDAAVAITIASAQPGKRRGKKCVKPTRKLAHAKSCQRLVTRGTLRRALKAGKRNVRFTGRIGKRKLSAGRYVATMTATDTAGNKSKKKTVKLRIVRR